MQDNKMKNNIILVVIALLIVGGLIYSNNNKKDPLSELDIDETETTLEDINNNTDINIEDTEDVSAETTTEKEKVEVSSPNKAKFDTAMKAGAAAFLKADYPGAIASYKVALSYNYKNDIAYNSISSAYGALGKWTESLSAVNSAIKANPAYVEYWTWKLTVLDEKTQSTFAGLKKVYEEGLTSVTSATKATLVTHFARMATDNGQKGEAIALWEYAKTLNPEASASFQAEIDRLKK